MDPQCPTLCLSIVVYSRWLGIRATNHGLVEGFGGPSRAIVGIVMVKLFVGEYEVPVRGDNLGRYTRLESRRRKSGGEPGILRSMRAHIRG
jgi:hypothetical protein